MARYLRVTVTVLSQVEDLACEWWAKGGYSSAVTLEALEQQAQQRSCRLGRGNTEVRWGRCRYEVRCRIQPPNFSRCDLRAVVKVASD